MRLLSIEAGFRRQTSPNAESRRVGRRQRDPVPQSRNRLQEARDLLRRQNGRELFRLATIDDALERLLLAHSDAIKEPQRASRLVDVRPGAFLGDQMQLIGADVLDAQPSRRFSKKPAKLPDRVDVGLLRRLREIADRHIFDHALAKRARRSHRGLLS